MRFHFKNACCIRQHRGWSF